MNILFSNKDLYSREASDISLCIERAIETVLEMNEEFLDECDLYHVKYLIYAAASAVELSYTLDRMQKQHENNR